MTSSTTTNSSSKYVKHVNMQMYTTNSKVGRIYKATDNVQLQAKPTKITPNLLVGIKYHAHDFDVIMQNKVTHVVSCMDDEPPVNAKIQVVLRFY